MSMYYLPSTPIDFAGLRAEIPRTGLKEVKRAQSSKRAICLSDGLSRLWAFPFGKVGTYLLVLDGYDAQGILARLADHFDTALISECDDAFEVILKELCATDCVPRTASAGQREFKPVLIPITLPPSTPGRRGLGPSDFAPTSPHHE